MNVIAKKFLSRKFILHAVAFIVGTVALFLGKLTGSEWVMLVGALGGSYGISNVGYHYAERRYTSGDWAPTGKRID